MSASQQATGAKDAQMLNSYLQDSDARYFRAAATSFKLAGGEFSVMNGLRTQASACVLHSITEMPTLEKLDLWISNLESKFFLQQAAWLRFYLPAEDEALNEKLKALGFRRSTEIAYACEIPQDIERSKNIVLKDYSHASTSFGDDEFIFHKEIARAAAKSPDGHTMDADEYVSMERQKVQAQYMQAYLLTQNSKPVISVNLDVNKDKQMARLKNMLCHPDARGKGMGRQVVRALMHTAKLQGSKYFGAYALENNQAARSMYEANGLEEVGRQYEWIKDISI